MWNAALAEAQWPATGCAMAGKVEAASAVRR